MLVERFDLLVERALAGMAQHGSQFRFGGDHIAKAGIHGIS
jgi:hypothetical protein